VRLGSRTRSALVTFGLVALVDVALAFWVAHELELAAATGSAERGRTVLVVATLVVLATTAIAMVTAARSVSRALRVLLAGAQRVADDARRRIPQADDTMIAGLAGSFQQIAGELDHALRSLAIERNRFEAVLQTMAPAVLALDAERRVTTVNRGARRLLGLPEVVEGRALVELVRLPGLHALLERAREGHTELADIDLPGPGQHQVLGRATLQPDGGVVVVLDDVTEVRRLERVRKDFVANVSHELRTPISVIKANAETLLEGALEDPSAARRFVEGLYRHADRLSRLVTDLLDISRLESGRRELLGELVDLGEAVEEVIAGLEGEADAKGVSLAGVVPDGLEVHADAKALEQVLFNLVDNAIKYSPAGASVQIAAQTAGNDVRIEVRDDGPGIDPKHRVRIFERFYRVDPGRSREMGGTGLGLSIVKHLVEAMGGEVGVEPRRPRGSVFWFILRSAPPPEDPPDDGPDVADDDPALAQVPSQTGDFR